jgi:hypothetical protein
MLHKFKTFVSRIRNMIRWAPIIWKDRDWDYYYVYEILKKKIEFQLKHIQEEEIVVFDYQYQRGQTILKLLDRVQNEYYIEQLFDRLPSGDVVNDRWVVEYHYNQHQKAKRILFKLLEKHIDNWWS